jgi:2-hydroxychromene-2-carboxylate isomerase
MSAIEVFADVWCPFTHVGLVRFVQRRAEVGADTTLHIRSWPLELVNGEPMGFDFLMEEIEAINDALDTGLFTGMNRDTFPTTTLPALRLGIAAYEKGAAVGEAVSLELRQRLFEQGEDVSAEEVLADVAAAHGVAVPPVPDDPARDPVVGEWELGRGRGVTGSPHYFTRAGDFFCPSLDVERVDGALHVHADPEAFDEFCRAAFTQSP